MRRARKAARKQAIREGPLATAEASGATSALPSLQ